MKWPINIPLANEAAHTSSGARARCIRGSSAIVFESAAEMNYCFDVMSLREHIKSDDGVNNISACNYLAKIARQRGGIARHVANSFWLKLQDSANHARFSAGARRVEQYEIKCIKPRVVFVRGQPI